MKSRKRKTTPASVQVHTETNSIQEVAQAHYEPAILLSEIEVVYNSRKSFDPAALSELAQSIATQGLLQPISLMQKEEHYILVAGERRYRACRQLGHTTIAALVRPWEEKTFLSLQLIENLQREDLPPLEEAASFAHMLKSGYSMEELVAIAGKSRSFIEKRVQLNNLPDSWRIYLEENKLSLASALEIARLPLKGQQLLYELIGHSVDEGESFSAKQISAVIEKRILLNLGQANFDTTDPDLWTQAGSCLSCTKRTACQTFLFADYAGENDQCLDAECFAEKTQRHYQQFVEKTREASPTLVLVSHYDSHSFPYADVYAYGKWQHVNPETEGAVPALHVSPHSFEVKDSIFYVKLKGEADQSPAAKEAAKNNRIQVMRENKIKLAAKQLAFEGLMDKEKYRLIDYYLKREMPANQATREWLHKKHGFSEPDFDTYDYKKREAWVIENTRSYSFEEKVVLYFSLKLRDGIADKHNTHLSEVAKFLDHSLQPYIERATEGVDAPKPKKERKGKKTKVEPVVKLLTTVETPGAEELPSRLRLKAQTEEQPQNAA